MRKTNEKEEREGIERGEADEALPPDE